MKGKHYKIAALATHPIQYHVPIFRSLATRPEISLKVFYASDISVRGYVDDGFGVSVTWGIPLLEGYESTFLNRRSWLENIAPFFKYYRRDIIPALTTGYFDALLVFTNYTYWLTLRAIWAAHKAGVKVLIRGDNNDGTGVKRPWFKERVRHLILKQLYSHISGFLAVGTYMRNHFEAHGVSPSRIFDSPHCVDDAWFEKQRVEWMPHRQKVRRELGFVNGDFVFIFSGKHVAKKNPTLISDALGYLKDLSMVRLLVVGDGPLRSTFENAAKFAIGKHAVFVGFKNQSELGKYYVASDALILPSSWEETWGLVVNEAQIFGLPAIVSDRVGCREDLVTPEKTGLIFSSEDSSELARCMRLLATHRAVARKMGENARERSEKYRVSNAVEGIIQALRCLGGE
jgi:glycosyltransferase involved in cell wall biosynthesis